MLFEVLALEDFNKAFAFLPFGFVKKGPQASFICVFWRIWPLILD